MSTHSDILTAKIETIADPQMRGLASRAIEVSHNAYVPASKFHVGCALLTEQGNVVEGCNVENASYGLTICAERNAITTAVAMEGPTMRIHKCAIYTNAYLGSPCGACRQFLAEFDAHTSILFVEDEFWKEYPLSSLLPLPFIFEYES